MMAMTLPVVVLKTRIFQARISWGITQTNYEKFKKRKVQSPIIDNVCVVILLICNYKQI